MKKLLIITALSILSFSNTASAANIAQVSVNGLVCDFCARALEKIFSKEEAVESIDVNLDTKIVTVVFKDGQSIDDERLTYLITDSGYNVDTINRKEVEVSPDE